MRHRIIDKGPSRIVGEHVRVPLQYQCAPADRRVHRRLPEEVHGRIDALFDQSPPASWPFTYVRDRPKRRAAT